MPALLICVVPAGCIALAEFLADHPRFLRLDLRNNDIRAGGWLALAHAAKMCPGLIRLDVSYDVKDAKHTDTIREAQKLIQTTCVNNIDEFDRGTAVPTATLTEETAAELTEGICCYGGDLPRQMISNSYAISKLRLYQIYIYFKVLLRNFVQVATDGPPFYRSNISSGGF